LKKKLVRSGIEKVACLSTITKHKRTTKKIMAAARKIPQLRTGKCVLMLAHASMNRTKVNREAIEKAEFTFIDQPPRSPDVNLLDACVP